jgi:branched-chain amino acid transport system permease protein
MNHLLHLLGFLEIYALVAVSLNLLMGYAGILQVAHAAFFGVGAYAYALLTTRGFDFIPALLCAGAAAGSLSLIVSVPARRFRGDEFVLLSLSVQVMIVSVMLNWTELTGGPFGITGVPRPRVFGHVLTTNSELVVLYGGIAILGTLCVLGITRGPFGLKIQAMRDDPLAAVSLGISTKFLTVRVFMIASALVGIAGALYAGFVTFVDSTAFSLHVSLLMLSMVIVGGMGNLRGPLLGAAVLIGLPEVLTYLRFPSATAADIRLWLYGLALVVLMRWRPQGLAGRFRLE